MQPEITVPKSLHEAIKLFADAEFSFNYAVKFRWPDGVKCPYCECDRLSFISTRKTWACKNCKKRFTVKVGTIMEDSPLPLEKWFAAMWLIANAKNGISSYELGRALGICQKTAWFLLHRVRHIMQTGTLDKMEGIVECDETYIGQKAKNMHYDKKKEKIKGRGTDGKAIVFGLLERGIKADKENGVEGRISKVRTMVVSDTKEETLIGAIKTNVEEGTEVFTDAHKSYRALGEEGFKHAFVDHAVRYVEGRVHSNGIECYWGLLDRMMHGTYTFALPHHLFRYTDELTYRFNNRDVSDAGRFIFALMSIAGKRLTWEKLTQSHLRNLAPKK
jgi:transposase-like protein